MIRRFGGPVGRRPEPARVRLERRAAQVRRRPWRVLAVLFVTVALLAGLGWLVGASPVLAARDTRVDGVDGADREAVLAAAQVPLGTPLARIDTGGIAERVRQVPVVRSVAVTRGWPGTVVVAVTPRVPVLAIAQADATFALLDDQLVSFRTVTAVPPAVALVRTEGGKAPDEQGVRAVLRVLALLPEQLRTQVSEITVSSASLVTFRLGGTQVIWGGVGQEEKKLAVLQILLRTTPTPKTVDVSAPDTPVTR